jgi:hypothetical protein
VSKSVIVQKSLKPIVLVSTFGNDVLVKNASRGDLEQTTFCMDIRQCRTDVTWIIENEDLFHFHYEDGGEYFLQFDVIDAFGNEETIRQKVEITPEDDPIGIITIPETIIEDGQATVSIGNSLDNEVTFYIPYTQGSCFMDSDIATDSDRDGDPSNDDDIPCNQVAPTMLIPASKQQTARVYYAHNGSKLSKDITINFIDYERVFNEEYERAYDELDDLIAVLPEEPATEIE